MSTQVNVTLPLVLVAHRTRDTVELLKALLEGEGFTTLCAYNGRAALQYARQHHPALCCSTRLYHCSMGSNFVEPCDRKQIAPRSLSSVTSPINSVSCSPLLLALMTASHFLFIPVSFLHALKLCCGECSGKALANNKCCAAGSLELDAEQRLVQVDGKRLA